MVFTVPLFTINQYSDNARFSIPEASYPVYLICVSEWNGQNFLINSEGDADRQRSLMTWQGCFRAALALRENTAGNASLHSAVPENPAAVPGPNAPLIDTPEAPADFRGFILG